MPYESQQLKHLKVAVQRLVLVCPVDEIGEVLKEAWTYEDPC